MRWINSSIIHTVHMIPHAHVWATEMAPLVQRFQQLRPLQALQALQAPRCVVLRHGSTRVCYRWQDRLVLKQKRKGLCGQLSAENAWTLRVAWSDCIVSARCSRLSFEVKQAHKDQRDSRPQLNSTQPSRRAHAVGRLVKRGCCSTDRRGQKG